MILVTVGLNPYGFDRLVRAADEMARFRDEPVVIQTGSCSYVPRFAQSFGYATPADMERWIRDARVVITHCAAGSILSVLAARRPCVVIPRSKRFGEAIDDHQIELADAMANQGRAVMVSEPSAKSLGMAAEEAVQLGSMTIVETGLHTALRDWLAQHTARPPSRRLRLLRWLAGGQ